MDCCSNKGNNEEMKDCCKVASDGEDGKKSSWMVWAIALSLIAVLIFSLII